MIYNFFFFFYISQGIKTNLMSVRLSIFSYPSVSTYVLGAQKNHLYEIVLLSTHNICFS